MARPRSTNVEAIIDTAAQLFLAHGFHNTSVEDVAVAVGISKPTVYSYVTSKQWLLDQIIARVINDLGSVMKPWGPAEPDTLTDQLDEYLDAHIRHATNLRVFYRILYSEETEMSPHMREQWRAFASEVTDHFVSLLRMYQDTEQIGRDEDLLAIANMFIPMLVSLHRWYRPDGPADPDTIRELAKRFLRGVVDL